MEDNGRVFFRVPILRTRIVVTAPRLRRLAAVSIIALVSAAPFAQVRDEPDLAAIAKIREAAGRRSQVLETVGYLTDVFGPRLTGSPQIKTAATYVVERLTAWGITNPRYERWGPFGPGWTNDRFVALVLAPDSYPLTAYPKAWTPPTTGEVVADAVWAPMKTEADFERYRGKLNGKFVLTAPLEVVLPEPIAAPRKYLPADLEQLATPAPPVVHVPSKEQAELVFARKRMEFFIEENVAVLLEPSHGSRGTVFVGDGRLTDDAVVEGAGFYPWPDAVATQVVLATEQYNRIVRTLEKGTPVTIEMNIVSAYHPADPDSVNIIAEIPGSGAPAEIVLVGAHLDSWHGGTGATDNAAGCAVVLEAMRILKATGLKMRRTVRLALWTGSEQGLLGSRAYITQHYADPATMLVKPEHAGLSAYFNLDGGTGAIRGVYLQGNDAAAPILAKWMEPFRRGGMTTLSPRTKEGSDHLSFDVVGLPAFQFIQDPLDYETRTRHSNLDVFDAIDGSALMENAVIVASFVYHAANRAGPFPRKALPPPNPLWTFPVPGR
jgi:carboxypeptidase Q